MVNSENKTFCVLLQVDMLRTIPFRLIIALAHAFNTLPFCVVVGIHCYHRY
jgi:hypothetical protein